MVDAGRVTRLCCLDMKCVSQRCNRANMFSVDSRTLARDGEAATAVGRQRRRTALGCGEAATAAGLYYSMLRVDTSSTH